MLNLYLQSLAESISCPAFTNISTMHRRKKRQTSAKKHDDIVTPQLPRYNKIDSLSSQNTSAEIRPISCVLGVSSDEADDVAERIIARRSKAVCEIRVGNKTRTGNLSKIYLRRRPTIHQIRTSLQ